MNERRRQPNGFAQSFNALSTSQPPPLIQLIHFLQAILKSLLGKKNKAPTLTAKNHPLLLFKVVDRFR